MGGYGYGYGSMMMGHDMWWHPLISLLWAVVVLVIALALIRNWRGRHCRGHRGGALEMLRERYAKGEISTAEYEERKKTLTAE